MEINTAIGVLDQSTQHNASLVEQPTAAAGSLQQQVEGMLKTLAVFQTQHAATR